MEMVLVDKNIMLICCILIPIYSANVYTAYVFVYASTSRQTLTYTYMRAFEIRIYVYMDPNFTMCVFIVCVFVEGLYTYIRIYDCNPYMGRQTYKLELNT